MCEVRKESRKLLVVDCESKERWESRFARGLVYIAPKKFVTMQNRNSKHSLIVLCLNWLIVARDGSGEGWSERLPMVSSYTYHHAA